MTVSPERERDFIGINAEVARAEDVAVGVVSFDSVLTCDVAVGSESAFEKVGHTTLKVLLRPECVAPAPATLRSVNE
jgi:hypothetical protein